MLSVESRLGEIVQVSLGEPGAVLGAWDVAPLKAGSALDRGRSVLLFQGAARVGAAERTWSLILKVLAPAAGKTVSKYGRVIAGRSRHATSVS